MTNKSGKVGFVSLGCPKALVDSERILTQLRMEGYDVVPTYGTSEKLINFEFFQKKNHFISKIMKKLPDFLFFPAIIRLLKHQIST